MPIEHLINRDDAVVCHRSGQIDAYEEHFLIRAPPVGLAACLQPRVPTAPFAVQLFQLNSAQSYIECRPDEAVFQALMAPPRGTNDR